MWLIIKSDKQEVKRTLFMMSEKINMRQPASQSADKVSFSKNKLYEKEKKKNYKKLPNAI